MQKSNKISLSAVDDVVNDVVVDVCDEDSNDDDVDDAVNVDDEASNAGDIVAVEVDADGGSNVSEDIIGSSPDAQCML